MRLWATGGQSQLLPIHNTYITEVQTFEVGATPVPFTTGSSNLEQEKMFRKHVTSVDNKMTLKAALYLYLASRFMVITNQPME